MYAKDEVAAYGRIDSDYLRRGYQVMCVSPEQYGR